MAQSNHFRFTPRDSQPAFSPLLGDVIPDRIYEVSDILVDRFVNHPDWQASTKTAYEKQETTSDTF